MSREYHRTNADIRAVLRMGYFIVRETSRASSLPARLVSILYERAGCEHQRMQIFDTTFWERYRLNDKGRAILEGYLT